MATVTALLMIRVLGSESPWNANGPCPGPLVSPWGSLNLKVPEGHNARLCNLKVPSSCLSFLKLRLPGQCQCDFRSGGPGGRLEVSARLNPPPILQGGSESVCSSVDFMLT